MSSASGVDQDVRRTFLVFVDCMINESSVFEIHLDMVILRATVFYVERTVFYVRRDGCHVGAWDSTLSVSCVRGCVVRRATPITVFLRMMG
jgi:hypothetical protein